VISARLRLLDYIYYCLYRLVLKTPIRADADAWPGVFLAMIIWIHGLTIYFFYTLVAGLPFGWNTNLKLICVVGMVITLALLCWYYVWLENAGRVIREYEKHGKDKKYARLGAVMFIETALLPLSFTGLMVLSQKLTGWPPHP
jgi:uncharacterized BrkB/YihY/UPF0761 family membrane protein